MIGYRSGTRVWRVTNTTMTNITENNAQKAFEHLYDRISNKGEWFGNTRALFNVGIQITNPLHNEITTGFRKWNPTYAKREWDWYCSGNPNAEEIAAKAPIWYQMMDADGNVRSNYGWQWGREYQLEKVIQMLRENPETRQAAISIYDGKEIATYRNDTPCTYAVQFTIREEKLHMSVYMRSNDLWFGFCNDQYCFSLLQKMVADELDREVGGYYHHAHNMHIYDNKLGMNPKIII